MLKKYFAVMAGVLATSSTIIAANITIGETLPTISGKGSIYEYVLDDSNDFTKEKWNVDKLVGKVRIVNHYAGNQAAKDINEPFIDLLRDAKLDPQRYQTTTIINLDEATWGTAWVVRGKIRNGKRDNPRSSVITDESSLTKKSWGLADNSNFIALLDTQGKVLFFKDGELSEQERNELIKKVIELSN